MTNIDILAKGAIGDTIVFSLFQAAILFLLVYAFANDRKWFRRNAGPETAVKRGPESWAMFPAMFGVLTLVVVAVNETTEAWKGYKTITTLADLAALFYLCYFNGWFRNKTVGVFSRSRGMLEK